MVQLLLDFGARPDVTNALGDRPLDVALRYEDQDMVSELQQAAEFVPGSSTSSCLMLACNLLYL